MPQKGTLHLTVLLNPLIPKNKQNLSKDGTQMKTTGGAQAAIGKEVKTSGTGRTGKSGRTVELEELVEQEQVEQRAKSRCDLLRLVESFSFCEVSYLQIVRTRSQLLYLYFYTTGEVGSHRWRCSSSTSQYRLNKRIVRIYNDSTINNTRNMSVFHIYPLSFTACQLNTVSTSDLSNVECCSPLFSLNFQASIQGYEKVSVQVTNKEESTRSLRRIQLFELNM